MRKLQPDEYAVQACGQLNTRTGQNKHFNVLTDWTPGDSHLSLYSNNGKFIIVAGYGHGLGTPQRIRLAHDQTHRPITGPGGDVWCHEGDVKNTLEGLELLRRAVRPSIRMCVLK
jgi:hypothetical protein